MQSIKEISHKGIIKDITNKNGYMGIGINFLEKPYLKGDEVFEMYRLEKLESYARWGLKNLKSFAFYIADDMAAINYSATLGGEPEQYLDEARIVGNVFFEDLKEFLEKKELKSVSIFKMSDILDNPFYLETKEVLSDLFKKDKIFQDKLKETIPKPILQITEQKVLRKLYFMPKEKFDKELMVNKLITKFSEYALDQIIFCIFILKLNFTIKIGSEREAKFDKILFWLGEKYKDILKIDIPKNFGAIYFK